MAGRKSTKTEELENATVKVESVEVTETVDVKDAVAEPIKKEPKVLVVNPMVNSTVSEINGKFYQISTGEYVSALSNITVS